MIFPLVDLLLLVSFLFFPLPFLKEVCKMIVFVLDYRFCVQRSGIRMLSVTKPTHFITGRKQQQAQLHKMNSVSN